MRPLIASLILAVSLGAPAALAQDSENAAVADKAGPTPLVEVERGGYAVGSFGFLAAAVPGGGGLATGSALDVALGYDFSNILGVGVFVLGAALTSPGPGDISGIFPGAELRLYLPIAKDGNGVSRLFFNVRAGGGAMILSGGATGVAPAGRAGVALEYFTRLRHFSIGLSLEGLVAAADGGLLAGGALSPFARYSF